MKNGRLMSLLAVLLLAGGCAPDERPAAPSLELQPGPAVGQPVAALALARLGCRMLVYDAAGKATEGLRSGQAGSLSVFAKDGQGQDNYTFDTAGRITHHRRSYGANFSAGKWEDVPPPAATP